MLSLKVVGAAFIISASMAPALAADAMAAGGMSMMQGGEVMSIMPDGHMGTMMVTDPAKMEAMMKMATPLDSCIILMTDKDGKVFMVKPTTKAEMDECAKMAM